MNFAAKVRAAYGAGPVTIISYENGKKTGHTTIKVGVTPEKKIEKSQINSVLFKKKGKR